MIGGPDIQKLEQYAKAVMADLRKVPGAVDVDSSLSLGKPQYGITIDRAKAARTGRLRGRHRQHAAAAGGRRQGLGLQRKGRTVRGPRPLHRRRAQPLDELKMVTVPSSKSDAVPLGDVVRFEQGTGPAQINRLGPHPASHHHRQHGARHVANRWCWTRSPSRLRS